MPRGNERPRGEIGDPNDPASFAHALGHYRRWLRLKQYPERILAIYDLYVSDFIEWCVTQGISRPGDVDRLLVERYAHRLMKQHRPKGPILTPCSRLVPVSDFFVCLSRCNRSVTCNPVLEALSLDEMIRLDRFISGPDQPNGSQGGS